MSRVPTYMILDDHEIKDAWTMNMRPGREVLYAAALSAYQSYQVVHGPAFEPSGPGDAEFARTPTRYWYRYDVGPARFFVLDTRNERYVSLAGADPADHQHRPDERAPAVAGGVAGRALRSSSSPRCRCSRTTARRSRTSGRASPGSGASSWRRSAAAGIRKVVFLAGDVHCSGWSELRLPSDPGFRVYSVISSPFFFPGPRLGQGDRFDLQPPSRTRRTTSPSAGHGPILGDDAFTRVSLDAAATVMRVDVYDRKGGLLDGTVLPL